MNPFLRWFLVGLILGLTTWLLKNWLEDNVEQLDIGPFHYENPTLREE